MLKKLKKKSKQIDKPLEMKNKIIKIKGKLILY